MQPTEQLDYILPTLSATVDRIQTMQMNDPTPCSEFTVHDVLNHMIVLGGSFSYWFRGEARTGGDSPRACTAGCRPPSSARSWTSCWTR